jgi:hypothetical protein
MRIVPLLLLAASVCGQPRLLLTPADFDRVRATAEAHAWARAVRDSMVATAANWPKSHIDKYRLAALELPGEGGQWSHHYVCPVHGVRLQFTAPSTHRCPVDNATFKGWPYDQVILQRRHEDLAAAARDLALAYHFSGEEHYAEQSAWILKSYAEKYLGYPLHDKDNRNTRSGARVLAQTLDESIWLIPIAWAYDLLRDADVLSAEERGRIERDLLRAAVATIERNDAGVSNWQSWHNAGIGAVAFTLADAEMIARVIDGRSGFRFQMRNSITPEGLWYEGAWSYHFYALDALVQLAEMAERSGIGLWAEEPLRKMFTAPLELAFANGTLPAFNDSGETSLVASDRLYEVAWQRTGDERFGAVLGRRSRGMNALFWGAPELPRAQLNLSGAIFEDAGFGALRSTSNDHALIFKFGPHGGGHGHNDKLNFVNYWNGATLAVDPGTQPYAAPTHNTWDKQTVAHNTVVVDETTQREAAGKLLWSWFGDRFQTAAADAGPAYAGARLRRAFYLSPDYVLDVFDVESTDGAEHSFDWVYHNNGAIETALPLESYSAFPQKHGYQHLTNNRAAQTDGAWQVQFDGAPTQPMATGSVYNSTTAVRGTFETVRENAASGLFAGRLKYESSGAGYILYTVPAPAGFASAAPVKLSMMIYGDGSMNRVAVRLNDSTDERFVAVIGTVDWTGWKQIEVSHPESWTHYLGNNDGKFDLPVRSAGIEFTFFPGGATSGALYVDDIRVEDVAGASHLISSFEIPIRSVRIWMLGGESTTVVAGEGLGPDLTRNVPFVMARRRGLATTFVTLLEPYSDSPRITSFRRTGPRTYLITGPGFEDEIVVPE